MLWTAAALNDISPPGPLGADFKPCLAPGGAVQSHVVLITAPAEQLELVFLHPGPRR